MNFKLFRFIVCLFLSAGGASLAHAEDPIVLCRNGGWCWFQSERVIVVDGKVVFTSIAGDDHGEWSTGDLVVTSFQPQSGEIIHGLLHAKLNQDDYTGLVALDPNDPNTVVISTNADPISGEPLVSSVDGKRHWKLFQGLTGDGGATWSWTAITPDSGEDQLRPVVPNSPNGPRVILWAKGKLISYKDYQLDIVGRVQSRGNECVKVH